MFSVMRALKAPTPAAYAYSNFYSTISGLTRRNWRTGSHPAPQSLAQDDTNELDVEDEAEEGSTLQKPLFRRKPSKVPTPHEFATHRTTLKKAFPEGWLPPRKLSREAMEGLRSMHALDPETFTTPVLSEKFRISPEAVRRILKSRWEPSREQRTKRAETERRSREEWITQRRQEEREEQQKLEAESGRPRRVAKNDRLTLT